MGESVETKAFDYIFEPLENRGREFISNCQQKNKTEAI